MKEIRLWSLQRDEERKLKVSDIESLHVDEKCLGKTASKLIQSFHGNSFGW